MGWCSPVLEKMNPHCMNTMSIAWGQPTMIESALASSEKLGFTPEQTCIDLDWRVRRAACTCGCCDLGPRHASMDGPVLSLAERSKPPDELRGNDTGPDTRDATKGET